LITEAKRIGYKEMLLDTLSSMKRAEDLYQSLGFTPITPYRYNPLPGAAFFQLQLHKLINQEPLVFALSFVRDWSVDVGFPVAEA
jgi:hypothetical protein